jgi:N-acetylglucosamine kinase-like BadF-type ATPase
MTRYFLGVDIGATKSHALIATEAGAVVGFGLGGSGNHEDVGYDGTIRTLNQIVRDALREAGLAVAQIAGAGFGVGGYDWPSERADTLAAIATLGLRCPVEAVNDTIIGLVAGAEQGWGVALVAGTSNNCRGRDREHREGRVMGNGTVFGENGGSYELVLKAVQEVVKAWTRRGPPTLLTQRFVEQTGARDAADLLEGLSQGFYTVPASAAPLVFAAAHAGDAVARGVIRWAAEELGSLAVGVIRQLRLEDEQFDVVLVGSLYNGGPLFTGPLEATIHAVAPGARFVRLTAPPVVGAVLIGMGLVGVETARVREALIASAQARLEGVAA